MYYVQKYVPKKTTEIELFISLLLLFFFCFFISFFFDDFAIYNTGDSGALSSELVSHVVLDLLLAFSSSLLFSSRNISLNLRFSQMHSRELHNPSIMASVVGLDMNFLKKGWLCKFSVASFGF